VALQRMDNVGIVVESLDAAIAFFAELGLELEGRAMIEGEWSGRVTGLRDQRVEIAMMRMPDGNGKIELSRFLTPSPVADHRNAPVNALGYLRVMFAVDDLDDTLARLREHGAQVVDEVVQYEDVYRLCYVRGPEGIDARKYTAHESLLRWLQRVWLLHRSRRGSAPPLRLSHLA
jgi:catechol 2,3-dioxygenase-like lactoylglutathione lyase family enzyme